MFGWVDVASTDQEAAQSFYEGLFGWEGVREPVGDGQYYVMFSKGGKTVAGCGGQQMEGAPSAWQSYIAVDDVDAIAVAVSDAGGTVIMPPMDVLESGRMLVLQDPTGAFVSAWQAKEHVGGEVFNEDGAFTWTELGTRDPATAMAFYEKVFGWTWQVVEGSPMEYWTASYVGQDPAQGGQCGCMDLTGVVPDEVPPYWAVYFNVADTDATAERAKELGGSVMLEPQNMMVGRFAMLADPTGAAFYVMTPNM
jgi:predicted enzyme related to lactoylglutathione lyase